MTARKHPITAQRCSQLLPQLARMRAKGRHGMPLSALQSALPLLADLGVGPFAGPTTRRKHGKAPHVESAVHQIDDADWVGANYYWLWLYGRHKGRPAEILQRVFIEADGEISDYDEIDEVGSYC